MTAGARTPEELDTLLEDAFVLRDGSAAGVLFDDAAVLVDVGGLQARGGEAIGRALADLWTRDFLYVAGRRRVLQSRDTALIVAEDAIHVLRRGSDGAWRSAISLLDLDTTTTMEDS